MTRSIASVPCAHSTNRTFLTFCLTAVFAIAVGSAQGQATPANLPGPWISFSVGAALPQGTASQTTTGKGATMLVGFGSQPRHRLSWSANLIASINTLPQAILDQGREPDGSATLFAIDADPQYFLHLNPRFNVWVTGGGGLSAKYVEFDDPSLSCGDENDDCVITSNATWQPAVDGGIGFAWRLHDGSPLEIVQENRVTHLFTPQNNFPGFNTAGTTVISLNLGVRLDLRRRRK